MPQRCAHPNSPGHFRLCGLSDGNLLSCLLAEETALRLKTVREMSKKANIDDQLVLGRVVTLHGQEITFTCDIYSASTEDRRQGVEPLRRIMEQREFSIHNN